MRAERAVKIEFLNLSSTERFAGATHEEVCQAFLAASRVADHFDGEGELIRFDSRYIAILDPLLSPMLAGGELRRVLVDEDVVVDVPGDDMEISLVSHERFRSAWIERGFVDLLLKELEGVTLHDPDRIWIEKDVRIDPGAVIWGGAVLRGNTHVGAAEIGPGVVLTDTRVADGAVVKAYSVCEGAHIGPDAMVGPMAHLRPKARLSVGVKVGNFVEVKNTTLHAGAKASHLSYLGDAEIGPDANIGAGTITCNYDGFNKWQTEIGAGAFIGSNTALVAPVKIHDGAIVAAGSTITREVAADALAITRADQKILPGMGKRIRNKNRSLKERKK